MRCVLLAVDGANIIFFTKCYQGTQCNFGGISSFGKHGFSKHSAPECYAIKTSYQLAVNPSLDAMRKACLMELDVSPYHFWNNPRAILSAPWCMRTGLDDLFKITIDTYFARVGFNKVL